MAEIFPLLTTGFVAAVVTTILTAGLQEWRDYRARRRAAKLRAFELSNSLALLARYCADSIAEFKYGEPDPTREFEESPHVPKVNFLTELEAYIDLPKKTLGDLSEMDFLLRQKEGSAQAAFEYGNDGNERNEIILQALKDLGRTCIEQSKRLRSTYGFSVPASLYEWSEEALGSER